MKQLTGTVINTKGGTTAKVLVAYGKTHPLYKKLLRRKKKYLADNPLGAKEGDRVKIRSCRPISKRKRWVITQIIENRK